MNAKRTCSSCGAELPPDAPSGLCVPCLLKNALPPTEPAKPGGSPQATIHISAIIPASEKPGDRIGRYKLLQEIGEGGMGTVWMAEQEEPVRRRVALKVIKLGMDTKQVIGRFEAERQALAMMDHPNIAKVLDAGATDNGRPFFVMELVKGIPITKYCDDNKVGTKERLELFIEVCRAIQHAHQKGIIHRDIKPSNILIANHDGTPVPKVIDFGIAKATTDQKLTDKTVFTAFEQFIGTPAYMSPEQAEMNALDIDTRTDVYSLGVLLYELLTGKTPFDAKDLISAGLEGMRKMIREKEPARPSTRISSLENIEQTAVANQRQSEPPKLIHLVSGDLDWVAMKCLEKDRTRRYETANGLAADVERHLKNEPVIACPPSNLYRFQKLVRRNKLAFAAVTTVTFVLALGVVASSWQAIRATRAEHRAEAARQNEIKLRVEAEANEKKAFNNERAAAASEARAKKSETDALWAAYVANLRAAESSLALREIDEARRRLNACPESHRGWEWQHLMVSLDGSIKQFIAPLVESTTNRWPQSLDTLAFSPDGKRIAAISPSAAFVWNPEQSFDPKVLRVKGDGKIDLNDAVTRAWVQFSPDSNTLLAGTGEYIRLWNCDSGNIAADLGAAFGKRNTFASIRGARGARCLSLSPDGKQVVCSDFDGLELREVPSGKLISKVDKQGERWGTGSRASGPADDTFCLTFSPDSQWIAAGLWDGRLRLFRARDLSLVRYWTACDTHYVPGMKWFSIGQVNSVAFGLNGHVLAAGSADGTVRMFDPNDDKPLQVMKGHLASVTSVTFSPSGEFLASGSADKTIRVWDTKLGIPIETLVGHSDQIASISYSPDGRYLASADRNSVRLWAVGIGGSCTSLLGHQYAVEALCIQGSRCASASAWDDTIRIWDLQTGTCLAALRGNLSPTETRISHIKSVALEAGGNRVAWLDNRGRVQVWDWATRELVSAFEISTNAPPDIRQIWSRVMLASKDLGTILTGLPDGRIEVWQPLKGGNSKVLEAHDRPIVAGAADPNWQSAVFGTADGKLILFDLNTRSVRRRIDACASSLASVAISNDGHLGASAGSDRVIRLWDLDSGRDVGALTGHDGDLTSLGFSPDGTRLISGSRDGTGRIWDVKRKELLLTLRGHDDGVDSAAFSEDGLQIITGDFRGTLRVWETVGAKERLAIRTPLNTGIKAVEAVVEKRREECATVAGLLTALRSDPSLDPTLIQQSQTIARALREDWWDRILEQRTPESQISEILQQVAHRRALLPSDFDARLLAAAIYLRLSEFEKALNELEPADKLLKRMYPYSRSQFEDIAPGCLKTLAEIRLGRIQQSVADFRTVALRVFDTEINKQTADLLNEAANALAIGFAMPSNQKIWGDGTSGVERTIFNLVQNATTNIKLAVSRLSGKTLGEGNARLLWESTEILALCLDDATPSTNYSEHFQSRIERLAEALQRQGKKNEVQQLLGDMFETANENRMRSPSAGFLAKSELLAAGNSNLLALIHEARKNLPVGDKEIPVRKVRLTRGLPTGNEKFDEKYASDLGFIGKITVSGRWLERGSDGTDFFFEELKRDEGAIVLKDASRNMLVQFPVAGGMARWSTDEGKTWNDLYEVRKE